MIVHNPYWWLKLNEFQKYSSCLHKPTDAQLDFSDSTIEFNVDSLVTV